MKKSRCFQPQCQNLADLDWRYNV